MAVRRFKYAKELEKGLKKKKPVEKAHKAAVTKAKTKFTPRMEKALRAAAKVQKPKITKIGKPYDKEGLLKKVTRKMREIYYGPKTYARRKPIVTARTKATIRKGLKPAGLTEKEIARLRGKK